MLSRSMLMAQAKLLNGHHKLANVVPMCFVQVQKVSNTAVGSNEKNDVNKTRKFLAANTTEKALSPIVQSMALRGIKSTPINQLHFHGYGPKPVEGTSITNALCLSRVPLAPAFCYLAYTGYCTPAFNVWCAYVSIVTMEGIIAWNNNHHNTASRRFMLPFVAKAFTSGAFATYWSMGIIPTWCAGAVIANDVLQVAIPMARHGTPRLPNDDTVDQFNSQMQLLQLGIVSFVYSREMHDTCFEVFAVLTTGSTLGSLANFAQNAMGRVRGSSFHP